MLWKEKKAAGSARDQERLLDAMLAFSHTQILAQVTDEASLDSRTVGLLAFNGALLGGALAAKALLGYYWWMPLIAVGVSTGPCLWSVFKKTSAFGPRALGFYEQFGAEGPLGSRTQLLSDLDDTFDFNAGRVKWKTWRLRFALATLVVGLGVVGLLIAVVRPTTIRLCAREQIRVQVRDHRYRCLPRRDFRLLVPVG
ncbi:MAG: hypothetical protein ACTHM1_12730 [Solirubrobacteraceae bacterium]